MTREGFSEQSFIMGRRPPPDIRHGRIGLAPYVDGVGVVGAVEGTGLRPSRLLIESRAALLYDQNASGAGCGAGCGAGGGAPRRPAHASRSIAAEPRALPKLPKRLAAAA